MGFKTMISRRKPDDSCLTVIEVIAIVESNLTTDCHLTMHRHACTSRRNLVTSAKVKSHDLPATLLFGENAEKSVWA